jgi:hypothetical protein
MKDHQPLGHLSLMIMTMSIGKLGYIYIQFIDYDLLLSIENGPHKSTKIKNDITVPKARSDYTDGKKKCYL